MGELQSLADASGGSLPAALLTRTPSPPINTNSSAQRTESIRMPAELSNNNEDARSSHRAPSPMMHSARVANRGLVDEDFQRNFLAPTLQIPGPNLGNFAPFSPAMAPGQIPSFTGHSSLGSMGGVRGGNAMGLAGHYDRNVLEQFSNPGPHDGNLLHGHRQSRNPVDAYLQQQQQQQLQQQQQQQLLYEQFGELPQQQQMPPTPLSAFQQQHRHLNSFGGMGPVGSAPDDMVYSTYGEDAFDDLNPRPRSYGGESATSMMRVPSYRRDYGRPSPSTAWQSQPRRD